MALKTYFITSILYLCSAIAFSQKIENVFLITTDGLRWQEVYGGADSTLIFDKTITADSSQTCGKFWAKTATERRQRLMPFLWSTIANEGQLYGNRWLGNKVDVTNPYWFSYPGYNEILTGYADPAINSNSKILNLNNTVLEFINQQKKFKNKVAAFATWDVFPYIINENRAGLLVNAGVEKLQLPNNPKIETLNNIQLNIKSLASDRQDYITYYLAKEYLIAKQPKLMFISFDETDEYAHEAKYREYLYAAHNFDNFLKDLWAYCQSNPKYKNKTAFVITTDHGRGDKTKSQWTSHGQKVEDCHEIWIAALGPSIAPLGELKQPAQHYQNQVAATVAKLLGYDFKYADAFKQKQAGQPIEGIVTIK